RLDAQDRLLLENRFDGFQPGEGTCFILLASERAVAALPSLRAVLYRPGIAQEAGHRYSEEPYRGDGLTAAVREAIASAPAAAIDARSEEHTSELQSRENLVCRLLLEK